MDENGDGEDLTPFWLQNNTNTRRTDRIRRRASSLFFSSGVVIFLLLVIAAFFLVFVLPSTLSFTTQIFRPNNVKKSWDSLNIVLVLVAVVFGFLSRIKNEDDDDKSYDEIQSSPGTTQIERDEEAEKPKPTNVLVDQWFNLNNIESQKPSTSYSNPDQWYQQLDDKDPFLKRNSSSYPDLRDFSSNRYDYGDYTRIFNDDLNLNLDSSRVNHQHRRHRSVSEIKSFETIPKKTKTIIVDTLVTRSVKPTVSTPPPENQENRQTERVVRRKERVRTTKQKKESEPINPSTEPKPPLPPSPEQPPAPPYPVANSPEFEEMPNLDYQNVRLRNKARPSRNVPTPSPPPPPPPPPVTPPPEKLSTKKSATKDFLNSLYHKKKKKPRQRSVENLDTLIHHSQEPITNHYTPPPATASPPPPPPPPPTTFQNIFLTKKQKRKRTISVTYPPPPPPPPPPATKPSTRTKIKMEENSNSVGESPLSRIPPPPPPPPPANYKNPVWKFVVEGDYVRVNSSNSSRSGSPDIDDVESDVTPLSNDGLLTPFHPSPAFCQSPDVNSKAESFITSFRAKLKLEKAHSMNGRQLGLSGLGRSSGPRRMG